MKEKPFPPFRVVAVEDNDNIIAYCPACETVIFLGSSSSPYGLNVFSSAITGHQMAYTTSFHAIDVIFPKDGPEVFNANTLIKAKSNTYILTPPKNQKPRLN